MSEMVFHVIHPFFCHDICHLLVAYFSTCYIRFGQHLCYHPPDQVVCETKHSTKPVVEVPQQLGEEASRLIRVI